jgi:exopolysaccharide biosynthesis protein
MKMARGLNFKRLAASLSIAAIILSSFNPLAAAKETIMYNKNIAKGIEFNQKMVTFGANNIKINVLTSDLNDPDVNVIFSKADDKVKKHDTLSNQIRREIQKGNNVVAGINADMFNMVNGFSSGPQIINGAIITSHNNISEQDIYPVFGIDTNKKPFIDYVHFEGKLSLLDESGNPVGSEVAIDSVNRENYSNSLVINTVDLNDSKIIDFSKYTSNGILVVVKGIANNLTLDKNLEGKVHAIYTGQSQLKIPNDGIVLAASGDKAQWIKNNLQKGSKIRIRLSYGRDIESAIGAYTYLVNNYRALTRDEMVANGARPEIASSRRARTAIGITPDNKVICIVSDGNKETSGVSSGLTLEEIGNYMASLGAVDAVALDGGGSSQMNVRLFGSDSIQVINSPSDGAERRITNAILFSSKAPKANDVASITPVYKNIRLYKNSIYKLRYNAVDSNNNPVDLSNVELTWKTNGNIGTVDKNGVLTAASTTAFGSVAAFYNNVYGGSNITVFDTLGSISIAEGSSITLKPKDKKQFSLKAKSTTNEDVYISNNAAYWSFSGDIGTVTSDGTFISNGKTGTGILSAFAGGQSAHITVTVSKTFSSSDKTPPKFYDYDDVKNIYAQNNEFSYRIKFKDGESGINDKSIKALIDGSETHAYYDAKSESVVIKGEYIIDGPHTLEVMGSDKAGNIANFNCLFTLYNISEDNIQPEILAISPSNSEKINVSNPRISVKLKDGQSGIDPSSLKIILDGKELKVNYDKSLPTAYSILENALTPGEHTIQVSVKDMAGNLSSSQSVFTYVPFKGPKDENNFSISFTSDIIGSPIGYDVDDAISKDNSSLVIVNGAVDSGYSYQWKNLYTNMEIKEKDIALGAGENDALIPSATYSFTYGNSLFIALDSSKGGITETDPTQFDYLNKVLSSNTKNNVFIFTHYLSRDVFGTKDAMTLSDAVKLQDMLTNYKKLNPSKNVFVVFGHAHGIKTWVINGVNYITTGNSSSKASSKLEDGGFTAYTKFNISGNNITREVIPVVDKVFIRDDFSPSNKIEIVKGTKKSLTLYGSFSPILSKSLIPISSFEGVKVNWTSSNSSVVSIDSKGVITANSVGSALIGAEVSGKTTTIEVTVGDQDSAKPGKIEISPRNLVLNAGQSQKLDVKAYTLYKDTYTVDNSLIKWEFDEKIGSIKDGIFTAAQNITEDIVSEIKAIYNGKISSIIVTIKKALK